MKVFTNNEFEGHYPVGRAAVVIAPDAETAARLLEKELAAIGLEQQIDVSKMKQVSQGKPSVHILHDGNY